ncbi:polycystin family receptor for egg jelly-like [Glandiceps talaboti]
MVIVEKGLKKGNYTMFVTVTRGSPPQMEMDCAAGSQCFNVYGGRKVNPTTDLRLIGKCIQDCDPAVTYEWDIQFYNDTSALYHLIPYWRDYTTGSNTEFLYIKKEFFEDHSDWLRYSISLTGTRSNGASGSSYMTMYINSPPSGGSCTITPGSGVASVDAFNAHCEDWVDDDGIEKYQFYSVFVNNTVKKQITFGRAASLAMFPPLGPPSNSYFQELWVKIVDVMGATTDLLIGEIQVRPPDENAAGDIMDTMFNKTLGNMQQYADLSASGNTREINKQTLIDASLLNALRAADRDEYESQYGSYGTTSASTTPQAAKAYFSKEKQRNRRAYLRSILLLTLTSSSLDAIEDVQLVSSTMSVATEATDELSPDALGNTVDIVSNMVNRFTDMVSTTDQNMLDVAGEGIIATLGNCFEGLHNTITNPLLIVDEFEETGQTGTQAFENTYKSSIGTFTDWISSPSDDIMTSTGSLTAKETKTKQTVQQAENALNAINRALLKNKLPGETPTIIKTPTISLQLERNNPSEIANRTYDIGEGQFTLPEWCAMKNSPGQDCTEDKVVDMELYSLSKNPYVFNGENSQKVSTDSHAMILNYRNTSGEEMSIQNTAKPIGIVIPRPSSPTPESMYYYSQPLEGSVMVYHNFNVSDYDEDTSVIIELVPDDLSVQYAVYIRYLERPTTDDYDHMFIIPSDMSLAGQVTLSPNPHSVSIEDSYVGKNTGKYVIGLVELDQTNYKYNTFVKNKNVEVPAKAVFSSNYTMSVSSSGCLFWSVADENWASEGCSVGPNTNQYHTECLCTHLTNFASAWVIPPNAIDFDYVFANMDFYKNPTIYIVTIVVFVFYFIGMIWCRRKDRRDLLMLGVAPLPDNDPNDKYLYEVVVLTGRRKNGGTNSKVSFILSGEDDETDVRIISDEKRKILQRGAVDSFLMAVSRPLGTLNYMRIWHDNSGKGKMQSWYLSYIAFRDLQTGERFYFIANRWFSVVEDDGQVCQTVLDTATF